MSKTLLFSDFIAAVRRIEGGNSSDAGGTSRGVTQVTYDSYRRQKRKPTQAVKLADDEEIDQLYFDVFYVPLRLGQMRSDWGMLLGVQAVNLPFGMAVKVVQSVLMRLGTYNADIDGISGPELIQAMNKVGPRTAVHGLDGMASYYGTREHQLDDKGLIKERLDLLAVEIGKVTPVEGA